MSESSATDSTSTSKGPKASAARPAKASGGASLPPWLTLLALVLGLAGVVLGALGLFFPSSGAKYSDHQVQEAKASVCDAAKKVRQAVGVSTHARNPEPNNAASGIAVAANARLGLYAGGGYLRARLAENPAAPADLTETVGQMANTLQELSLNYLGDVEDPAVQQPLREDLNARIGELDGLCQ